MDGSLAEIVIGEWLGASLRWLHVIAGIAWIGSSFYFIHLDASLKRREGLPEGVGGEAWQVHGGGFYRMQKYLVAPPEMPSDLTWFKWEAYTTWISGFLLLCLIYYAGAELYLIDPHVLELPVWLAIAISAGSLLVGWLIYDQLCKSPLGRNNGQIAIVGFLFLVLAAWLYTLVFSGRSALIHAGALIGTIMVANVAHIIIPNQRTTVADLLAGRTPDPALGATGKQRSLHNNYLTLPVIFLMISGHYPLAFDSRWSWLIVACLLVMGAAIRHFYNLRHAGRPSPWWTWGVAAVGLIGIVLLSWPRPAASLADGTPAAVANFAEIENIILSRCSMCHAAEPVWEGVPIAPKGIALDTPELILRHAREIRLQAVVTHAMPPGNITEISDEERALLAAWFKSGTAAR